MLSTSLQTFLMGKSFTFSIWPQMTLRNKSLKTHFGLEWLHSGFLSSVTAVFQWFEIEIWCWENSDDDSFSLWKKTVESWLSSARLALSMSAVRSSTLFIWTSSQCTTITLNIVFHSWFMTENQETQWLCCNWAWSYQMSELPLTLWILFKFPGQPEQ